MTGIGAWWSYAEECAASAFKTGKSIFRSPDAFLKVFQAASAALRLAIEHSPSLHYLSRLEVTFRTAEMHNFYLFLKRPQQWFYITPEMLDPDAIVNSLASALEHAKICQGMDSEDFRREAYKKSLKKERNKYVEVVRPHIKKSIDAMRQEGGLLLFRSAAEMNRAIVVRSIVEGGSTLEKAQEETQELERMQEKYIQSGGRISCFRSPTLLETFADWIWPAVDLGCVALYARDWKLLDTVKWAARIGEYSVFSRVPGLSLDNCVLGLAAAAFGLGCLESCRKLHDDHLDETEKSKEGWNAAVQGAEAILWSATLASLMGVLPLAQTQLNVATLGVKVLGLARFLIASKA